MWGLSFDELGTVLLAAVVIFGSQYLGHASKDAWDHTKRWYRRHRRITKKSSRR